jgi:hypothetical protein
MIATTNRVLADWNALLNHVARHYEVARRGDDWLQLVWTFPTDEGEPLAQVLEITRAQALGGTFVRLLARVVDRRALDANAALRLNFSLVVGHLAHHDDAVVLMHYLPLPAAAGELDRALELVPHEAARLRHTLTASVPHVVLGEYAD